LRRSQATFGGPGAPFIASFLAYQREHPELAPLLPRARAYLSGGAPKSPTLFQQVMQEFKAPILSGWGMTEAPMLTFNNFGDDEVALSSTEGRPGPGVELIAVTADGSRAAAGDEGELRIKAPQLMRSYLDARLNADAFDAQGYFRTGDLGRVDVRGNVTITGRLKDVIIRNMENISAKAVEDLLLTHPKVADVAVIAVPDPKTGERACAVVVPKSLADAPTLPELCEHLGRQGMIKRNFPEQIEVLEQLPRTPTGKVLKAQLRKHYGGR
jgi:acyl-CoA synthetase (AMP-forming)/AMP-acid ligase II